MLACIFVKQQDIDTLTGLVSAQTSSLVVSIDTWMSIRQVELPELYKDRAAGLGTGCVFRLRRIADIGAGRVVTVFVLKDAIQDEKLLTSGMDVRRERAARCISDDRCRPGNLIADPVEHAAVDTGHRRSDPRYSCCMNGCTYRKISVQFHWSLLHELMIKLRLHRGVKAAEIALPHITGDHNTRSLTFVDLSGIPAFVIGSGRMGSDIVINPGNLCRPVWQRSQQD